jgi:hypothetical protein
MKLILHSKFETSPQNPAFGRPDRCYLEREFGINTFYELPHTGENFYDWKFFDHLDRAYLLSFKVVSVGRTPERTIVVISNFNLAHVDTESTLKTGKYDDVKIDFLLQNGWKKAAPASFPTRHQSYMYM